jgi:hypothetical protein
MLNIRARHHPIEMANPRPEHECAMWKDMKWPERKALVPGTINVPMSIAHLAG